LELETGMAPDGPTDAVPREFPQLRRDPLGHKTPPGEQQLSTTPCVQCGAEHDPDTSSCHKSPFVGRTLRDGIRIRERLGDTPVGELYRAEYASGVDVAVLLLGSAATFPVALAVLRQRICQAIQIQHLNVAAIHDLGETPDGLVYVVAECLTGKSLSETLARRGALPEEEALDLCLQAAAGLQAAHAAGWVHGNLSPETMVLTSTGGGTLLKLIGFTQESAMGDPQFGTPVEGDASAEYASPERLAGRKTDQRSDVYSLGAVLHHLVTGVPPAQGSEGGRVPDGVHAVLKRALAPSPARRFQTVAEFVAALARAVEPVADQRPEPTKAGRRKLVPLGAAASALVAVFAGLWLLWGMQRPVLDAPSWAPLGESGSVAPLESDSISSSSASSAPARLPAHSAPAFPVRRESVSSRLPGASGPPPAPSSDVAADSPLVDVRSIDPSIQTDLRYATANNFTGAPLPGYEAPRALLRPEAAAALGRVQAGLRSSGLGLRVLDAYRPVRASLAMVDWAERTEHRALLETGYIARRSRHNLGVAVDLTLVDLKTGTEVPMGTTFDNFSAAQPDNVTGEALRYRQILLEAMESEGFSPYGQVWWHFNYPVEGAVPLDRVIR
jgi:zinc D-Ala-D-Ala dipeptidase